MHRRSLARFAVLLVLTGVAAWATVIPPALARERARVIVRFDRNVSTAERVGLVQAAGGRVVRDLHLIDGVGAQLDWPSARRLARHPGVRAVSPDGAVSLSSTCGGRAGDWCASALATAYMQSTRTDKAWTDSQLPATGAGVGVAVIDTGIVGDLPDFAGADGRSRVIASAVTNPAATTATDRYGHGTHVAGLVAGNGRRLASTDPLYNRYIGTAPDANLISIKASDDAGQATIIDVIDGLQFAVDHKTDLGIRVVNLSLNSTQAQSYRTDPLDAAAEAAWFAGLVVVTAAGNQGTLGDAVSYPPAYDPSVISVGGVDDKGTKTTDDDLLASWSSRGVTQDGFAKPDVVAPAAHIAGPLAPRSAFGDLCPACIVSTRYFRVGGTSMASAIVAGVAADLLQAHPAWTPDQVKQALITRARPTLGDAREGAPDLALNAHPSATPLSAGIARSTWLDPTPGVIDYTRASWRRASWSTAAGDLAAGGSRASWRCADCGGGVAIDSTRASWRRASWSTFFGDAPPTAGGTSGAR